MRRALQRHSRWPVGTMLTVILLALALLDSASTEFSIGFYTNLIESIYPCKDETWNHQGVDINMDLTKFSKDNPKLEPQRISGNATLRAAITNNQWMHVRLDSMSNGEWKQNAYVFNFPSDACKAFKTNLPMGFQSFFHIDPASDKCPAVGLYQWDNEILNVTSPNVPMMQYGHYRMRSAFGVKKTTEVCIALETYVVPKPKSRPSRPRV